MVTCIFAGHREVYQSNIAVQIEVEIERLLQADREITFLTGGMGQFDSMGIGAVQAAKRRHPDKRITLALVLPYMSARLNADREYYQRFDQIIIPEEAEVSHYKAAIQIRNRWMVNQADIVVAYICRGFGGALATVRYAQKQGKPVINLAEKKLLP